MIKINYIQKNRGFTIIETLVAITILMISIAGPLTIANKSLMAAIYAKDQVTASFLAQDLMEDIKNQRDSALASGMSFATWVANYKASNPCNDSPCQLGVSTSDGTYVKYTTGTQTKFSRQGYVLFYGLSNHEAEATVIVLWDGSKNSVIFTDDLFDVSL